MAVYRFNDYELDTSRYGLTRNGEAIEVEPKVFDLLRYLIEHHDRMVSREELFEKLWTGQVVSDTSLSNQIKAARKAIGDDGKTQACIKTVHGRGYQFVSTIAPDTNVTTIMQITDDLPPRSKGPVVSVLPFQNLSSDAEQTYFCEGVSEDITTELSRFSGIQVISRHSSFQFGESPYDIDEIRQKIGADFLLEGSVRRSAEQVRLNAQLIEAKSREHVWAERYDFALENIFEIQDEIVETVVSTMTGQIMKIEMDRARSRSTDNLSAYDHLLRGLSYHKTFWATADDFARANFEFNRALELDPGLARARAWRVCSSPGTTDEDFHAYIDDLNYTLTLDPKESETHRLLGTCYLVLGDYDLSRHHFHQAVKLNPNESDIVARTARFYVFVGELDRAQEMLNRAVRLNPLHQGWYWAVQALIEYVRGDYNSAISSARRNTDQSGYDLAMLAVYYLLAGDEGKASEVSVRAIKADPSISISEMLRWDRFQSIETGKKLERELAEVGIPA